MPGRAAYGSRKDTKQLIRVINMLEPKVVEHAFDNDFTGDLKKEMAFLVKAFCSQQVNGNHVHFGQMVVFTAEKYNCNPDRLDVALRNLVMIGVLNADENGRTVTDNNFARYMTDAINKSGFSSAFRARREENVVAR